METVRVRRSRGVALATLVVGLAGLAAALAVDFLRKPLVLIVMIVAILVGVTAWVDRRVKLVLSDAGIRYAGWGGAVVPWREFAGYRWTHWRGQPYLQLLPRRPTELVAGFSAMGKLNHSCAGWLRMPRFGIGASGLAVSETVLTELIARHLPEQPAGLEG